MTLDDFIRKYRIALFKQILKDPDFNIQLYLNNNEVRLEKLKVSTIEPLINTAKNISKEDLEKYISDNQSLKKKVDLSSDNCIYSENGIEFVNQNEEYFEMPFLWLSCSKNILWSDRLIEKYAQKWNWQELSCNTSINWDNQKIEKFEPFINFKQLSGNSSLNIDAHLLNKYESLWDWNKLSGNSGVIRKIENTLLAHPKAIWTSERKNTDGNISYDLEYIKPCICSNPGIKWSMSKFLLHREKIDFWLLALYGDIDVDVIMRFGNQLNQNFQIGINCTRYSDWRDNHPIYRNGWENWLLNKKVSVNREILFFLYNQKATLVKHSGNARTGHHPYEVELKASDLISSQSLNLTFKELHYHVDLLPETFFSDIKIDQSIYSKIIKKALKEDDKLINNVINSFFRAY